MGGACSARTSLTCKHKRCFPGAWACLRALPVMTGVVFLPSSLAQQYVYPQAFLQPSLVLQSQLSPTVAALASPYLDHSSAYSHYAAAGLEPYPYVPSPSLSGGYLSYSFSPGGPALTASPAPSAAVPPPLATLSTGPQAFLHYPLHQADRIQ